MPCTADLESIGLRASRSFATYFAMGRLDMTALTHCHGFLSSITEVLLFDPQLWIVHLTCPLYSVTGDRLQGLTTCTL